MQRVKLFKGVENDVAALEREVNDWLEQSGARIVNVFGNIAPQTMHPSKPHSGSRSFDASDILIVVVHEQG